MLLPPKLAPNSGLATGYYPPMPSVLWSGRPADAKLVEQLRGRGIRIAQAAQAEAVAEVVAAAARACKAAGDAPTNGLPWIWFAAGAVAPDDAGAAVARGAYDVIDAREPGAIARLVQRIAELTTVEPPVPATD